MIVDIFQIQHNIYPPNASESILQMQVKKTITAMREHHYRYVGTSLPQCGNIVTALR